MAKPPELARLWPAAGIRVQAGDLELRWIDDTTLVALADLASRGVHDPDFNPFGNGWARGTPTEVARRVLSYQWAKRAKVTTDEFDLELAVVLNGEPIGMQGIHAKQWAVLRQVSSGSWLGIEFHGRGIGKRMRALVLHFAFASLGAEEATTMAFADNASSNGVSRSLGYEPDGAFRDVRDGRLILHNRYRISRARWEQVRPEHERLLGAPVVASGHEAFLDQIR